MAEESLIGLKYPFEIRNGSVVSTTHPTEIIGSRVTFCLGSWMGERVMRPTWGITLLNASHAVGADLYTIINESIEDAFAAWFGEYEIRGVKIEKNPYDPTYVTVEVRYGLPQKSEDLVSRVGVRTPDGTETFVGDGF
jgi:hypothetical protein